MAFFFSRKEAKALVLLRRRSFLTQFSAKPTLGVWGLAPKKTTNLMIEAKALEPDDLAVLGLDS
jgi:hypothetical protein